ncbi:MAG TPA: hypothetical protein VFH77_03085 [Streptomyces sp.]|nr:hypothetical protein [Streptomyces sp.]
MTPPSPHVDTLAVGDRIGREQGVTCCGPMGFHGGGSLALWECPECGGQLYVDHDPARGDYIVVPTPGRPGWPTHEEKQMTDIMKQTVTPAQYADNSAEAIRAINHATLDSPRAGWEYPGDAYSLVGNLSQMAMMMPQAIGQIRDLIEKLHQAGTLRSDRGQLAYDLAATFDGLEAAQSAAELLHQALNRAHNGLGPIGLQY